MKAGADDGMASSDAPMMAPALVRVNEATLKRVSGAFGTFHSTLARPYALLTTTSAARELAVTL